MRKESLASFVFFWMFAFAVPRAAFAFACERVGPTEKDRMTIHVVYAAEDFEDDYFCPIRVFDRKCGWEFLWKREKYKEEFELLSCEYQRKDPSNPKLIYALFCELKLPDLE